MKIRNLFQIKDKNNSFIVIFFCFLNIVLGLLFNNREIVGLIPIIAHPERYEYVQNNINCLQEYLDKGVLFQSNYSSIIGGYGILAKKTVIKLLQNGMVHCLGTDCHRPNSVYKQMDKILKQLSKLISDKEIELLTTVNPMKILNNQILD